ncbi:triose-phosphate isomerase [Halorhabdus salina]|uniref:triose-phosphate isomerase n=1 Tax=Halorhabdus salina TaxID=2750670 RepID=UPI00215D5DB6|nr:triose-phosphate isomerase [Halorhabdus salina]
MGLPYPHCQISYKDYRGTDGFEGLELARTIERIAAETGRTFARTPQLPDIRLLSRETTLPIIAPSVDPVSPGRATGRVRPEALSDAGAVGAVINHTEKQDTLTDVQQKVERCRDAGLDTIVCVDSVETGRAVAPFEPDQSCLSAPTTSGAKPRSRVPIPNEPSRFSTCATRTPPRQQCGSEGVSYPPRTFAGRST